MLNPFINYDNTYTLIPVDDNFWDLTLATENGICFNCDNIAQNDLYGDFDFNSVLGTCNNLLWNQAFSFDEDLCDIGLTGYDNRFVPELTGQVFNPEFDKTFCAFAVSGDNFCYEYHYQSGDIVQYKRELTQEPEHIKFCGGFFQGFYKLEGYNYQTMPNEFLKGWTREFWLKPEDCLTGEVCQSGHTLNDFFPNNKGFFHYMGIRAENKFCNPYAADLGLKTCKGIPLFPDFEIIDDTLKGINPFLYYNRLNLCKPKDIYGQFDDCCDGLINNAMGFRLTDDGEIGVRLLTTTGECVTVSGETTYDSAPIMEEYYTDTGVVEMNQWSLITVKYKPYNQNRCAVNREDLGTLSIYVNGRLKLRLEGFSDFVPYALDEHKDKQLGVPYNISFGGGTQGLLEAGLLYFGSGDVYESGDTLCDYNAYIGSCDTFLGVVIDGTEYPSEPYTHRELSKIKAFIESVVSRQGTVKVTSNYTGLNARIHIEIKSSFDNITDIITNNGYMNVCQSNCIKIKPFLGSCGYLEDNFAGTFIGGMGKVRMYERPLCYHEIKCNYDLEKEKYLRIDINPCSGKIIR